MSSKAIAPWQKAISQAERKFNDIALSTGNQIDYQTEAMFAMQAIQNNNKLMECSSDSIRNAVINIASVGLSLNPARKQAYLVPRGGIAVLDISYIGLVKLATDSKAIRYVCADVVREKDQFITHGKDARPDHAYSPFLSESDRGPLVGVYCYARLQEGDYLTEIWNKEQIEEARKSSKSPNSPAWKDWYGEMAKKSIIKRAQKLWPQSDSRLQAAINVLNEHEGLKDVSQPSHDITMPQRASEKPIDGECETVNEETGEVTGTDANTATITSGQMKVLQAKLKAMSVDEASLLKAFEVEMIADIPASKINDALTWIEGAAA